MDKDSNSVSNTYIIGIISIAVALFVISGIIFLLLVADKLDVVMNCPPAETYTYFMMIMDRLIAILTVFAVLPLSIYQWKLKNKTPRDIIVSGISVAILFAFIFTLISGEAHFYNKYSNGELANAKLFRTHTIEMQIFDKIK